MAQQDILDYIRKTPYNSNVNVVKGMIGNTGNSLPEVTESDNGMVLTVVNGEWDKAAGGGGDAGYECTEGWVTLTEESVITTKDGQPIAIGSLSYEQLIDAEKIRVTFNGTEYECERVDTGVAYGYGGAEEGTPDPNFSQYPFMIASSADFGNLLLTEEAGTYNITIETATEVATTTPCFEKAVKSVIATPLRLIPNVTTKAKAVEAFNKGLMMYFINSEQSPNRYEFITSFSPNSGDMSSTPATNILYIGFSEENDTFYYTIR